MNRAGQMTRAWVHEVLYEMPNRNLTAWQVAYHTDRSESWVREILRQMVRDGRAERITEGPGKPVYYRLKETH